MIRIQLVHEGRVVKQISSRVHEGIILEQVKRFKDPVDEIRIIEGELSEAGKDMLHHVARKIIPAAIAAGVAMGGANAANAQNRDFPGMDRSIGQHISDIVSPNYKEMVRQRKYAQDTERQAWNAEQNELRQARIRTARDEGRQIAGNTTTKVYDQARTSADGKYYIIYSMDNHITRIPTKGTEFMPGDSQRLPHYISPNGTVYYVRHNHINESDMSGVMHAAKHHNKSFLITAELAEGGKKTYRVRAQSERVAREKFSQHYNQAKIVNVKEEGVEEGIVTPPTIPASGTNSGNRGTISSSGPTSSGGTSTNDASTNDDGTTNLDVDQNGQLSIGEPDETDMEESMMNEDDTLQSILDQYSEDYKNFKEGGEIDDNPDFFDALYEYFSENGEMPYGVQKARDGDPYDWIANRLDQEAGIEPVAEGAEFGSYYSEELAQKVFDQNPNLDASGKADAVLDAGWPFAVADLGKKSAQHKFVYDEDFPSDFVSAYSYLQQNQGVTEGTGRAVDAKGRTQQQWIQAVKKKFPDAKIMQSKMIDGPCFAMLADGRKLSWTKVEQVDEIIDPSTVTAKALRYIGGKFATAFPWLAVGGVGAGLAASGLLAPLVASMGGVTTALSTIGSEMAFSAGIAGTYAAPSIIQTIKDLFAADENSIQAGIKRWVEKHVGDDNDVHEFMSVHSKAAYEGKTGFRWRAKEWPVKMTKEQAEAYLEKNEKSWLDYEKQKAADAEKAKAEKNKEVGEGYTVVPGIDKERYQERPGLEGPFHAKSGKVVYYDKQEGKYYDPDSDFYISNDDWQAMNEARDDDEDEFEANSDEQAGADKNIIMQLRKAADYNVPSTITLGDGTKVTVDPVMAMRLLGKFNTLKPQGKELMQQTLNAKKGYDELVSYVSIREEAQSRAKNLVTSIFGKY